MTDDRDDDRPPDPTDRYAEELGLMTFAAAARALGHSTPWVKDQILRGRLRSALRLGRPYVVRASVEALAERLLVDLQAAEAGRITPEEAAAQLGHSMQWVRRQIGSGVLRTSSHEGRTYIFADDIQRHLAQFGRPDELQQRLEVLEDGGDGGGGEAMVVRRQIQAQLDDRMRRVLGHPRQAPRRMSDLQDAGAAFINQFNDKGKSQ